MRESIRVSRDFVSGQSGPAPARRAAVQVDSTNWRASIGLIVLTALVTSSVTLALQHALVWWFAR